MAEELDMKQAKQVYEALIASLDARNWTYQRYDEDLTIKSGVKGEDLPIEFLVRVKPGLNVVQFISVLPCSMPEDKRVDGAIATCVANYGLVDGSFDYDITDGEIRFRMTSSYRESNLGADLFDYMIMVAAGTVDQYNDRFFMLSKGMINIQQFIEQEK